MSTHGHSLAAMSTQEYPRAFICSLVHSWAWCAMTPRALFSVLWALRHTYEHSRRHDTILISSHVCSWVLKSAQTWSLGLRSALEWSRELMNTQVLNWTMTKKCWFLKWPPCSIFPKTQSRFDQIIKNRIFLKSIRKWLLKNVKDGISRPLGSRVIQKTKRSRELRDTL